MQKIDLKSFLPHIYIIAGFIVVAFIFSSPQFDGVLYQGDTISWKASAHEAMEWHKKTGENTFWSNSMFGGMPTYTHYVPETNNIAHPVQRGFMGIFGKPAGFLILAMLGFYMLGAAMRFNKWICAAGAVAYAFSTYNITLIEAGHETKMFALAYLPAVLGGLIYLYKGDWWRGIPLLSVSLLLFMSTGHYQIMYYSIMIILGMVIIYFINLLKEGKLKQFFVASGISLGISAIAVGCTMQLFLVTLEYNKTTMRGGESELTINHDEGKKSGGLDKEYAFRWSNEWAESFTVLIPMYYGGASQEDVGEGSETADVMSSMGVQPQAVEGFTKNLPTYRGSQPFTGGPFYFGAVIVFLFVLGLFLIKSNHKWWVIGVSALAFLMSLGYHFAGFNYFLFDTLPGFNKFRVPNMILTIPQLLFPFFAAWALNDALSEQLSKEKLWKAVKLSGIITASLCVLALIAGSMSDYKSEKDAQLVQQLTQSFGQEEPAARVVRAIQEDRASMATKSGITSIVFIALMVGLLWAYSKNKLKAQYVAFAAIALIAADLIRIDTRYLNEDNFVDEMDYEAQFEPRPVDRQIQQDPDPYYRVLDLSRNVYNNSIQSIHHKCIGGYSPAKMEIYQDMIDIHMNGRYNAEVLNMLNTKYIISPQGQGGQPVAIPNPEANGNAWFVNNIKWAETADDEILALNAHALGDTAKSGDFDSKSTAVLRSSYKNELNLNSIGKDSATSIMLTKYGLNDLEFASSNSQDGFAVFSDIYYPYGWHAYIDGEETPIYKTNYLLRGIKIPAGDHKIVFEFHPEKFIKGDRIAGVCSLLLLVLIGASVGMSLKGKKKNAA